MSTTWKFELPKFKPLDEDKDADVCVVGGGLAGFWCAYLLASRGKEVVLLEKDTLGGASTAYTTAFITEVLDTDYTTLVKMFGSEKARRVWQAGRDAVQMIAKLVKEEKIDCDFEYAPLYSFVAEDKDLQKLREEHYLLTKASFKNDFIDEPLSGFKNIASLCFPDQAKYNPMKFLAGLVGLAKKAGVQIYEKSEVIEIGKFGAVVRGGFMVKSRAVILATYEPLNNPKPLHFKKGVYTSYVYDLQIPKGRLKSGLFVDKQNPYHYFRIDDLNSKEQRLIVGGEDHRKEINFEEAKSFRALRRYVDETFLDLDYKIMNRWKGDIIEPSDGLPLIGEYAPEEYVATAFSGTGMTYAALAGRTISDLIIEGRSSYSELYDPRRKMETKALVYKIRDYTGEFIGGAVRNLLK